MGNNSWMLPKLIQYISILILLGPIQAEEVPCNNTGICLKCTGDASTIETSPVPLNWNCIQGSQCDTQIPYNYNDTEHCVDKICFVKSSGTIVERGCGQPATPPGGTCPHSINGSFICWFHESDHAQACTCDSSNGTCNNEYVDQCYLSPPTI
ncbi:unnamed protein product [Allacma fusca]|uniref:Sodefrin-like factor n=1 Tax=Allacma fusca TaxID=39272 RepID=A0A8J2L2Q4_9HEXA|nr:unnamed protein product [Allacma fusca]